MKKNNFFFLTIIVFFAVLIFRNIFLLRFLAAGDYTPLNSQVISSFLSSSFYGWNTSLNTGYSVVSFINHSPFNFIIGIISTIIPDYNLLERVVWWLPFFIISIFSILKLFTFIFPRNVYFYLIFPLFLLNTYILMILGGGQVEGIGLAYSLSPYILFKFFQIIEDGEASFKQIVLMGLLLTLEVMFDPRITYVLVILMGIYVLMYTFLFKRFEYKNILKISLGSSVIVFLLHAFWIIPSLVIHKNPVAQFGQAYTSTAGVKFLSFATFENAMGLLHPNWPENIFGKISFMRPEFLLLPLIFFSILCFVKISKTEKRNNFYICYFLLTALLGIFLVKGATDPFGNVYLWMFDHIPGFIMFRDPTKWFLLIILSYTILIPLSIEEISKTFKNKFNFLNNFLIQFIFSSITLLLFFLLILPSLESLTGIFAFKSFPSEYSQLNTFLTTDKSFSRVLWIPSKQRYGQASNLHPAISAYDFYHVTSIASVFSYLKQKNALEILSTAGVKYIIIPADPDGELFITDRKYDNTLYANSVTNLSQIHGLEKTAKFNKNVVFQTALHSDHIALLNSTFPSAIAYIQKSPTEYTINVHNITIKDTMIFSESYDSNWVLMDGSERVLPHLYQSRFMQFAITKSGSYSLRLIYLPQEVINFSLWISRISFILFLSLWIFLSLKTSSSRPKMIQ